MRNYPQFCRVGSVFPYRPVERKTSDIRDVCRMLRITLRVSSSHHIKRKIHKNTWLELSGFLLHSAIDTLTVLHFTCSLHCTFTVDVPNWITIEFLLFRKSQFTIDARNVLHLHQCTPGHVWLWNVAPCQTFRGGCEWFYRHHKTRWSISSFSVGAENTKDWCRAKVEAM